MSCLEGREVNPREKQVYACYSHLYVLSRSPLEMKKCRRTKLHLVRVLSCNLIHRPASSHVRAPERPRSPGTRPRRAPQSREREPRAAGAGPTTRRSSDTGPGTAPAVPAPCLLLVSLPSSGPAAGEGPRPGCSQVAPAGPRTLRKVP